MNEFEADMKWSSRLFVEQVWPAIKKHLGGGDILRMEGRPDTELARRLDMLSGIDGWHIHERGMRGIASRVQHGIAYNTFTIRMNRHNGSETEYQKRLAAIKGEGGWIYPHLTVQAYAQTKEGPILSAAVAKTEDVIDFIERNMHETRRTTNADFAICAWDKIKAAGYKILTFVNYPACNLPPPAL